MKFRKFRLMNEADASGGGGTSETELARLRGDFGPAEDPADAQNPTSEKSAADLEAELAAAADKTGDKAPDEEKADDETGDKTDDKADPDKNKRIPLSRHKQILERERAVRTELENQLKNFQQGERVAKTNEDITAAEDSILAKEAEYNKLMGEGRLTEATKLMTEIRRLERGVVSAQARIETEASEARLIERTRYTTTLARIEEQYPVLNEDNDAFDPDKAAEVLDLKAAYQTRGSTPTDALQKAVKVLLGAETAKQETATTVTPRVTKEDVAQARAKEARTKAAEAANKTPGNLKDVGVDSDKLGGGAIDAKAVMGMSQDDFAKLSDETLAKMRGDFI